MQVLRLNKLDINKGNAIQITNPVKILYDFDSNLEFVNNSSILLNWKEDAGERSKRVLLSSREVL